MNYIRINLLAVLVIATFGCASMNSSNPTSSFTATSNVSQSTDNGATTHGGDPRFIFEDRAPASFTPVVSTTTDKTVLDPMYLRTQADYHFTLGEAQALTGNSEKAIEEFKLALVYDPESPTVRYRLGGEFLKRGLISEAIEQNEQAVSYRPDYNEARLLLGTLYTTIKMYDKAEEQYQSVLSRDPNHTEANLYYGAVLAERGSYAKSIKHFEEFAKNGDERTKAMAYYYIGRVYVTQKNLVKAEAYFTMALKENPKMVDATLALGAVWEDANKKPQAIGLYATYQDKFGPDVRVAKTLGALYMEQEDFDHAYRQYEIIESAEDDNLNVKVKMALVLIEQKKYPKAVMKLKEVLAQAPESDKIRFYLGAVYEEVKEYDHAIGEFMKIPLASSYYSEAMVHASYLQKQKGEYSEAKRIMEAAIENRPEVPQFYTLYSSLLEDEKNYVKAAEILEKAVKKFPDHEQVRFFYGFMQDKLGNREKTIASMKMVLDLNPEHVQALNFLAYTYAEMGAELTAAAEYSQKAMKLKPNDGYITDTYGWVLFKQGKIEDAVKVLEIANKLVTTEALIAEHLGDAYHRNQLPLKAKAMYKKALEFEKDPETLRKLQAKIQAVEQNVAVQETARSPASVSGK